MHQVRTSTYGILELVPYDTRHYSGLLLAGSEVTAAQGDFGSLVSQLYQSEHFNILVNHYRFRKKTHLWIPVRKGILQSISCIRGQGHQRNNGSKLSLRAGQYYLTVADDEFQEIQVDRDKEYWNFIVSYEEPLLTPMLPYFSILPDLLQGNNNRRFLNRTLWMDKYACNLIEQVMHATFDPALRAFLFKERVEDLLHSMLIELSRQPVQLKNLSSSDIEKVYQARAIILENVKDHHNLEELCRKVELNEFKMKEGFRQLFGKGPYGLLKDARLQLAHDLILRTNRPEKDIMTEAGYSSLTAFVRAFRALYGVSPGKLRYRKGYDRNSLRNG